MKLVNGRTGPACCLWIILAVLSVLPSASLCGETGDESGGEVLAMGSGRIVDGNVTQARVSATSDALLRGVESYLTRTLGSRGMANNFSKVIHDLIPSVREDVEQFNILAEDRSENDYRILVRLKVNEKAIEEKMKGLGLVLAEGPPIRVLFMVSQVESQEGKESYWWGGQAEQEPVLTLTELTLYRVFEQHGFRPINRLSSLPEGDFAPEMKSMELGEEALSKWGQIFSADVVIHGRCEIVENEHLSIHLTAVNVAEKKEIYQDSQGEALESGMEDVQGVGVVMERAVNKLALRMSPAVIKALEGSDGEVRKLEIGLRGLKGFRQFREFTAFLEKDVKGVKSVRQSRVAGNMIYVAVEFTGEEETFLKRILNHENLPFRARMTRSDEGEITFDVNQE